MKTRQRDMRYCYDCHESTWHLRGGEFTEWVCQSRCCIERRTRQKRNAPKPDDEKHVFCSHHANWHKDEYHIVSDEGGACEDCNAVERSL